MTARKHLLLILAAAFLLHAAAPSVNPLETEAEFRRMLDFCRATACPDLPVLLNNFGGFYFSEGRYKDAEPLLSEAVTRNTGEPAALAMSNLATLYRLTGRFVEAESMFDQSLEALGTAHSSELPRVLVSAALLGLDPRATQKDAATAEARCARALELTEQGSALEAAARSTLGAILETQARFKEAQPLLETALAIREASFGPDSPLVAETLNKLGLVHRQMGRLAQAEEIYRRALAILRAHPATVELGAALNNLGNILAAEGRADEAEGVLRESLAVWEKVLGPDHPNVAAALSNLSTIARTKHKYADAERLLARAIEIDRKLPAGSVRIGLDLNNAGALLAARKHYTEAEKTLRDALAILEHGLPADHPEIGRTLVNLGEVLRLEHKDEEAEACYRAGIEILATAWGPDDVRLLSWLEPYAGVARSREDYADAAKADVQAMKIRVGQTIAFRRLPE